MYDSPQVERDHIDRLHQREGGLSCSKARYYNPNIGRFVSEDPIGFSERLYLYGQNDPANSVDPLGLKEESVTVEGHVNYHDTDAELISSCNGTTGGGCTPGQTIGFVFSCNCNCEMGIWRADARLNIKAEIHIFNGNWRKFLKEHPPYCDKSAVDVDSAIRHEYGRHLDKAKHSALVFTNAINAHPYAHEWECTGACRLFQDTFPDIVYEALAKSKKAEEICITRRR
jgi:RHS repeat-associated protein